MVASVPVASHSHQAIAGPSADRPPSQDVELEKDVEMGDSSAQLEQVQPGRQNCFDYHGLLHSSKQEPS